MNICMYGAAKEQIDKKYIDEVYKFGRLMAEENIRLVFGGGQTGLMGAAARGVYEGGGKLTGIAPKYFDREGVLFQNCTELIYTDTMRQRKQIMEDMADAFVVAPGGIGTFEEFFEMLTLKGLGQTQKPIIILNIGGYYDTMFRFIEHSIEERFTGTETTGLYSVAATAKEAIQLAIAASVENVKRS